VTVCNTPGVLDETTADLAFLLILAALRLGSTAEADLRGGRWPGWGLNQYLGHDAHGCTLGVVGWGRIGRAVARRAGGFGMTVLHHSRTDDGESGYMASLDDLLARADVVTLHVPLTPDTHHLVDGRRLALMKPTAVLVNTARGAVVDEVALAAALHEGTIFAAGLDVFEDEPRVHPSLLAAPRTVLLPHIGSATVATRTAMGRLAAQSVVDVLDGRVPPNRVSVRP
jgi:glyoxylate reductase